MPRSRAQRARARARGRALARFNRENPPQRLTRTADPLSSANTASGQRRRQRRNSIDGSTIPLNQTYEPYDTLNQDRRLWVLRYLGRVIPVMTGDGGVNPQLTRLVNAGKAPRPPGFAMLLGQRGPRLIPLEARPFGVYNGNDPDHYYNQPSAQLRMRLRNDQEILNGRLIQSQQPVREGDRVAPGVTRYRPAGQVQMSTALTTRQLFVDSNYDDDMAEKIEDFGEAANKAVAIVNEMWPQRAAQVQVELRFIIGLEDDGSGALRDLAHVEHGKESGTGPITIMRGQDVQAILQAAGRHAYERFEEKLGDDHRFYGAGDWRLMSVDIRVVAARGGHGASTGHEDYFLHAVHDKEGEFYKHPLLQRWLSQKKKSFCWPLTDQGCFWHLLAIQLFPRMDKDGKFKGQRTPGKAMTEQLNQMADLLKRTNLPATISVDTEVLADRTVIDSIGKALGVSINVFRVTTSQEATDTGFWLLPSISYVDRTAFQEKHLNLLYWVLDDGTAHYVQLRNVGQDQTAKPSHNKACHRCGRTHRAQTRCGLNAANAEEGAAAEGASFQAQNRHYGARLPLPFLAYMSTTTAEIGGASLNDPLLLRHSCRQVLAGYALQLTVHPELEACLRAQGRLDELRPLTAVMTNDTSASPGDVSQLLAQLAWLASLLNPKDGPLQRWRDKMYGAIPAFPKTGQLPCAACGELLSAQTARPHHEHAFGNTVAWTCQRCNKAEQIRHVTMVVDKLAPLVEVLASQMLPENSLRVRPFPSFEDPISCEVSFNSTDKVVLRCARALQDKKWTLATVVEEDHTLATRLSEQTYLAVNLPTPSWPRCSSLTLVKDAPAWPAPTDMAPHERAAWKAYCPLVQPTITALGLLAQAAADQLPVFITVFEAARAAFFRATGVDLPRCATLPGAAETAALTTPMLSMPNPVIHPNTGVFTLPPPPVGAPPQWKLPATEECVRAINAMHSSPLITVGQLYAKATDTTTILSYDMKSAYPSVMMNGVMTRYSEELCDMLPDLVNADGLLNINPPSHWLDNTSMPMIHADIDALGCDNLKDLGIPRKRKLSQSEVDEAAYANLQCVVYERAPVSGEYRLDVLLVLAKLGARVVPKKMRLVHREPTHTALIHKLLAERRQHDKGTVGNLICKTATTSLYGKLGQATENFRHETLVTSVDEFYRARVDDTAEYRHVRLCEMDPTTADDPVPKARLVQGQVRFRVTNLAPRLVCTDEHGTPILVHPDGSLEKNGVVARYIDTDTDTTDTGPAPKRAKRQTPVGLTWEGHPTQQRRDWLKSQCRARGFAATFFSEGSSAFRAVMPGDDRAIAHTRAIALAKSLMTTFPGCLDWSVVRDEGVTAIRRCARLLPDQNTRNVTRPKYATHDIRQAVWAKMYGLWLNVITQFGLENVRLIRANTDCLTMVVTHDPTVDPDALLRSSGALGVEGHVGSWENEFKGKRVTEWLQATSMSYEVRYEHDHDNHDDHDNRRVGRVPHGVSVAQWEKHVNRNQEPTNRKVRCAGLADRNLLQDRVGAFDTALEGGCEVVTGVLRNQRRGRDIVGRETVTTSYELRRHVPGRRVLPCGLDTEPFS